MTEIVLSNEREANFNYIKLGKNLQSFQVSLAKSNKSYKNIQDMYKILCKENEYQSQIVSSRDIDIIEDTLNQPKEHDIINLNTIKYYIKDIISDTNDLAELL